MVEVRQAQGVGHNIELVFAKLRQQILRQNERIDIRRLERDPSFSQAAVTKPMSKSAL